MEVNLDSNHRPARKKRRVLKKGRLIILILLISALGWLLAVGVKSFVYKQLVRTETLQSGVVTQDLAAAGVVIKQEYVIAAPLKGTVKFSVAEGDRVKAGTSFGTLSVANMDAASGVKDYALKSPVSGVLCTHLDGLETILVPGNLDGVEIPSLEKIESNEGGNLSEQVDSGQPLAKVIDNLEPIYIYAFLKHEDIKHINIQKGQAIQLKWQDQIIEAIIDRSFTDKQTGILLMVKNYPDELLHLRKANFKVTTGSMEGILVTESALVTKENKRGIYLNWKGLVRWVPVEIIHKLKGQAAIKGEYIQPGVSYVVNPKFAREGDRL